jgi:hypothetical protein
VKISAAVAATTLLAALIYGANFGWWLDGSVIDPDSFVESTVEALDEESSRTAVSQLIVDQMIDEFPLLIVLESNLVLLFSDLLSTDAFSGVVTIVAVDVHERIVTGNQEAIVVSLIEYRDLVLGPLEVVAPRLAELVPDQWFNSIEILEPGAVPDLSDSGKWIGIVKVLAALGALALMAAMLWLAQRRSLAVVLIGVAFSIAGVATVMLVPGARWLTLKDIDRVPVQVVIGNTYDAFTHQLLWSAGVLFILGVTLIVLGAALWIGGADDPTEPAA